MKKLPFIGELHPHSSQNLFALAGEAFDCYDPHLLLWQRKSWTSIAQFVPPDPKGSILGSRGDLWLISDWEGALKVHTQVEWLEYPLGEFSGLHFYASAWLGSRLLLLAEKWEDLTPAHTELIQLHPTHGLQRIADFPHLPGLYDIAANSRGTVFIGGRSSILQLPLATPPRPTDVAPVRLETAITGPMSWNHLAISQDDALYAGGEVGIVARATCNENGDYRFKFLSMGRDDCAIDQLIALPDNSILCVFAGRLYQIRGLTPEDITPPSVEHVTCVAAASDGLVVGTLEQSVWVGPPWRQLPPIEVPD